MGPRHAEWNSSATPECPNVGSPYGREGGRRDDAALSVPPELGRKRDHARYSEILDAALEILAETGYDGMTVDVAARAKARKASPYRRWPSKAELVVDALACLSQIDLLSVIDGMILPAVRKDRPVSPARAHQDE